jgi:hypothetical protein
VVESFASARTVARPNHRAFGVVAGQDPTTREGKIRVFFDMCLVGIPCRLGSTLSLKVCIDSCRN